MSIDPLLIQVLIACLAGSTIAINSAALTYSYFTHADRGVLRDRPLARAVLKALVWVVRANLVTLIYLTFFSYLRNYYGLVNVLDVAPWFFSYLVAANYLIFYLNSLFPAVLLASITHSFRVVEQREAMAIQRYKVEKVDHSEGGA